MTRHTYAPGPLLALAAALCALAFATTHPVIVAAVLVGGLALLAAARAPRRGVLTMAAILGLGVALLNPFVQASGDLILFELPDIPVFDMQVTLEEVVTGATLGARAAAVTIVLLAVLALADPDRLLGLASRLMPRSALAASIAARLVPTLRRDAQALVETARLRGRSPLAGTWRGRARAAGSLAIPLVGSALDRSVDVAEAMAARGYGSGPRTRLAPPPRRGVERVVMGAAAIVAVVAGLAIAGAVGAMRFYPTLGPLLDSHTLAAAGAALAGALVSAWGLRR